MTTVERLEVPQSVFAGRAFWSRVDQLADAAGHTGHQRMLVGEVNPTDRYTLRCQTCSSAPVMDVLVKREAVPA